MPRQPARVHKTFYRLKLRANFFIGNGIFEKTSFCTARPLGGSGIPLSTRHNRFIAPWTVVRSDEFVNKKAGIIAALTKGHAARNAVNAAVVKDLCGSRPPYTEEELRNSGHTHYVGDSCPGGHSDCAPTQPASDNNVTGPTS